MKRSIEELLYNYPVIRYEFIGSEELTFTERVRTICRDECPRYVKSLSFPPATGEVESCRKMCLSYPNVLLYTTQSEVEDAQIMEQALASRKYHEEITREILAGIRQLGADCFALSGDSCQICEHCAYPEPCRHPEQAIPCIESYGIVVPLIAEKYGIEFYTDLHTVTWFGMIFWRQ